MKLAEALLQRSTYQKKIENLQSRILANLKVQEEEEPDEDPQALLDAALALHKELCELVKAINACNNRTRLPDGRSLSDALADRENLMKQRDLLARIASSAGGRDYRTARSELRTNVLLSARVLQQQVDRLSAEYRALDVQIQATNWITEF
ncbi:MAG: DIP1984 family protein [Oscillospiraceae bacterium]|jgi:NTP pyrophosphatase (non-canonical NTP hydrolase)|nr:DIP1984 family protein [Oscillospiraceae bacterium]